MSDCTKSTILLRVHDSKRSSKTQSCITYTPQIDGNHKRMKCSIKKCTNHVTFAMEDVYINGYTPYESGITDAEVIRLYHNDIWYTKTDYNSFMQDRIDTIRVYRSVNGNMSGLDDFYCIHGLEQFLAVKQPMKTEHRYRLTGTSARTNPLVHDLSHPKRSPSPMCAAWLTVNNALFLNNALFTIRKSKELGILELPNEKHSRLGDDDLRSNEEHSALNDDDFRSYSTSEKIVCNVETEKIPVDLHDDIPFASTLRRKIDAVDVKSLRIMNIELLKSLNAKADSSAMSLLFKADTDLLTMNDISSCSYVNMEGVGKIPIPDKFNTSPDFVQLGSAEYNAAVMNVMDQALEITSTCFETISSTR